MSSSSIARCRQGQHWLVSTIEICERWPWMSRCRPNLIGRMPRDVTPIAESGFTSSSELAALRRSGYRGFLVGERLMTSADPGEALRDLLRQDSPVGDSVRERV